MPTYVPIDQRVEDSNGSSIANAQVFVYVKDTTTPVGLFADSAGATPLTQPLLTDSEGRPTRDSASHTFVNPFVVPGVYSLNVPTDTLNPTVYISAGGGTASAGASPFINVVADYGAVGDGTTNDTTAVQNALNAAKAAGGTVFFPIGVYKCTSTVYFGWGGGTSSVNHPYRVLGASRGRNTGSGMGATLLWTGGAGTGPAFSFSSINQFACEEMAFEYTNNGFDGDLVDVEGNTHGSDCTNWSFRRCTFRAQGTITARSSMRLWKAINGTIDACALAGAVNSLRFHDNSYCVEIAVRDCTFNFSNDAHILMGSPDGENIIIDRCTFEAGTNTGAIRGGLIASGEATNNQHYNPTIRDCWTGDNSAAVTWFSEIHTVSTGYPGTFTGNRLASARNGVCFQCGGTTGSRWVFIANSFETGASGSVFGAVGVNNVYLILSNGFVLSGTGVAWTTPPGSGNYTAFGNSTGIPDTIGNSIGVSIAGNPIDTTGQGVLQLGSASHSTLPATTTLDAIYRSTASPNPLTLQGPSIRAFASNNERIRADSTGIAFNGSTPTALPTYTVTNPTTDRALNVTADTLAQGLQVLGTLIADLQARGLLQ